MLEEQLSNHQHYHQLTPPFMVYTLRKMLKERRLYGLPGTTGRFQSNSWEYILQDHSLISVVYAHVLSPLTVTQRGFFFAHMISFLFMVVASISPSSLLGATAVAICLHVPYKALTRFAIARYLLDNDAYDEDTHDPDDLDSDHIAQQKKKASGTMMGKFGGALNITLVVANILHILIGSVILVVTKPDGFLRAFFVSLLTALLLVEVLFMMLSVAVGVHFTTKESDRFRLEWGSFFAEKQRQTLVSITQVAVKAKMSFIAINNPAIFKRKYKNYDEWFKIPPEGNVVHLNFDMEAQHSYELEAGQAGDVDMLYTENPLAAASTDSPSMVAAVTVKKKERKASSSPASRSTSRSTSRSASRSAERSPSRSPSKESNKDKKEKKEKKDKKEKAKKEKS